MDITIALPKKTLHTSYSVLGLHVLRTLLAITLLISRNWKSMQHSLIWLLFSLHWSLGFSLIWTFYSWSGLPFPPSWGFPTCIPHVSYIVQFSSVALSCPALCNPTNCSTPKLSVHHQLPEFTQTHVHWVGDVIQPSHSLSSPSPPAFNLSQHQGVF